MISKKNLNALKNQLKKHNDSVRSPKKKVTLNALSKSFKRGLGASYSSPQLRLSRGLSANQWALGRTQELLKAVKKGKPGKPEFKNKPYDLDLILKGKSRP